MWDTQLPLSTEDLLCCFSIFLTPLLPHHHLFASLELTMFSATPQHTTTAFGSNFIVIPDDTDTESDITTYWGGGKEMNISRRDRDRQDYEEIVSSVIVTPW
jgi:hypothetical protein